MKIYLKDLFENLDSKEYEEIEIDSNNISNESKENIKKYVLQNIEKENHSKEKSRDNKIKRINRTFKKAWVAVLAICFLSTGVYAISRTEFFNNLIGRNVDVVLDEKGVYWDDAGTITITDEKIKEDILEMIEESKTINMDQDELDSYSSGGSVYEDNQLKFKLDGEEDIVIKFKFDTLYDKGFIQLDGEFLKPSYDFFRYIMNLKEYKDINTNISQKDNELFKKYNWTIDYRINSFKEKLPSDFKHNAGEYPIKIYWAYNNELSKSIGLDLSDYLSESLDVEIYRLREPLPEYMQPRMNARGIVLKDGDKIVGAFIDAGRHSSFACSLDRKNLEEINNKNWSEWIQDFLNYEYPLEKELASLSPKEVIELYYDSINNGYNKKAYACLDRTNMSNITEVLSSNMSNTLLYNKEEDYLRDIKKAELLSIEKLQSSNKDKDTLEYRVNVDYKYHGQISSFNGEYSYIVSMKKEKDRGGWKIISIGN